MNAQPAPAALHAGVLRLAFAAEMTSDWHLGSGRGRPGDVDRLVKRRRRTNLPYLAAKSLTGVLTDEIETVAAALDARHALAGHMDLYRVLVGDDPVRDAAVRRRGGNSTRRRTRLEPAALAIRPADLRPAVRDAILAEGLQRHATIVVRQTAMTSQGTAKSGSLRMTEVTRQGQVLHGHVEIDLDRIHPQWRERAVALVQVSAGRLRRIGAKRRRGLGRIDLRIAPAADDSPDLTSDAAFDEALALLGGAPSAEVRGVAVRAVASAPSGAARSEASQPTLATISESTSSLITVEIEALNRLVIEDRVVGNLVRTIDHIPGARLLGIVANALRRAGVDPTPLIESGALQVRSATPDINGVRSLPVPASWFEPKHTFVDTSRRHRGGLFDGGSGVVNLLAGDVVPSGVIYRQARRAWVSDTRIGLPTARRPLPTQVDTMNTIDDHVGRPTEHVGGVYSYETLDEGEVFRTEILAPAELAPLVVELLSGHTDRVGTSKKDDFGGIVFRHAQAVDGTTVSENGDVVESFSLWCISPLVALDATAEPITSLAALGDLLGDLLGVTVRPESVDVDGTQTAVWSRPFRDEVWKAGWGLPNHSVVGVAAGSVARYRCEPTVPLTRLRSLERRGIGLRLAAGFGEVRINHPVVTAPRFGNTLASHSPDLNGQPVGAELTAADDQYLHLLRVANWREQVRRKAMTITLGELLGQLDEGPVAALTKSRLGDYRDAVARLRTPEQLPWLATDLRKNVALSGQLRTAPQTLLSRVGLQPPGSDDTHECWREAVTALVDGAIRNHTRGTANATALDGADATHENGMPQ